jgi:hypothetical protein
MRLSMTALSRAAEAAPEPPLAVNSLLQASSTRREHVWRPLARRNVRAAAMLTLFSIHTNCLFVPTSLVTRTRVIAALPLEAHE